ncbi:MAG: hypothetical protein NT045_05610 [Candidatus Aureabacteria bacterium]|nr:hypothetical protein [Candidatus Auribacterota bacterium]
MNKPIAAAALAILLLPCAPRDARGQDYLNNTRNRGGFRADGRGTGSQDYINNAKNRGGFRLDTRDYGQNPQGRGGYRDQRDFRYEYNPLSRRGMQAPVVQQGVPTPVKGGGEIIQNVYTSSTERGPQRVTVETYIPESAASCAPRPAAGSPLPETAR